MTVTRVQWLAAACVAILACLFLCPMPAHAVSVSTVASPADIPREKQITYSSHVDYGNPSSVKISGNSDLRWGHPADINNKWNYLYLENQYSKGTGSRAVTGTAQFTYEKMCKASDGRLVDLVLTISDIRINRKSSCPSDRLYLLSMWPGGSRLNTLETSGLYYQPDSLYGASFKVTTHFYYAGTKTPVDGTFYMQANDVDAIDFINSHDTHPELGEFTEAVTVTSTCGPTAWVLQNTWLRWYATPQGLRFYNANMPVDCHDNVACTMICGLNNGSSFYWSGANCSTWIMAQVQAPPPATPKGGLTIEKQDSETGSTAQGDATFAGIRFSVTYTGAELELDDGSRLTSGTLMATLTTDESGRASVGDLPYGTYAIQETSVGNSGYLLSAPAQTVTVSANTATTPIVFRDNISRGSLRAQKIDADLTLGSKNKHNIDLKWPGPQGNATLAGAQFGIYNVSKNPVTVNGKLWPSLKGQSLANATPLAILTTDAAGKISLPDRALSYGTYVIRELKAPSGYLINEAFAEGVSFAIHTDGMWYIFDGKGQFIL